MVARTRHTVTLYVPCLSGPVDIFIKTSSSFPYTVFCIFWHNKWNVLRYISTLIISYISLFKIQFVAEEGSNCPQCADSTRRTGCGLTCKRSDIKPGTFRVKNRNPTAALI
jgi:hypothetical protein